MGRPHDVVTFDCYGTLVDWEQGISEAVIRAAADDGLTLTTDEVLAAHAEIEPAVQAAGYRSYHDVLVETALRIARRFDWELAEDRARFLPQSLPEWQPFPDTNPALERLAAAGYRLGILSNIDDDLLAGTLRHLSPEFELQVTAQQVRSYKPAHAHFRVARERIGVGRWLHAAQSYFHDVVPARELDIPVAWINRNRDTPSGEARPDHEFPTLTELATHLCG